MASIKKTPKEFGLKVRSHPGRLVVTASGKRRKAEKILLSYDGKIAETIVFDRRYTKENFSALDKLVDEIGRPSVQGVEVNPSRYQWKNVQSDIIINFLSRYRQKEEEMRTVKASNLAKYIENQNRYGELKSWDIVIVSRQNADKVVSVKDYTVGCVIRRPFPKDSLIGDTLSIKRLVSPADEMLDLSSEELEKARAYDKKRMSGKTGAFNPSGLAIRYKGRPKERGLLLIYLPSWNDYSSSNGYGGQTDPVVGFAISFPASDNVKPIEYYVNTVYAEDTLYAEDGM